ncbi:hypothetical protein [Oryzomicrobium sp.]|uniref:hypothetical protein n=1 Tax=Oryzomicrobium sp. TaxID=1911578 RepID=UPI0025CCDD8A|nr:hypothetical protein [Oryzomicrobium sp.]MCE1244890.1 hypothetical protein [Oryzomicrobium sp.]
MTATETLDPHAVGQAIPGLVAADPLAELIRRLESRHGFAVPATAEAFDAFAAAPGEALVLFAEAPDRVPESHDVAVVLPEAVKHLPRPVRLAVLPLELARALAGRYGVRVWPAVVALRDGAYLGAIEGMRDWAVYQRELGALVDGETRRAPGFAIPVASAAPSCGA